ncbi:MAG TPA: restriction endonuclease, partial [Clostridia bacterium]|nr:restriction endonuclease [Clostridia bacterium]
SIPRVVEYRYSSKDRAIKPVQMKQKEVEQFYESVLYQIVLRTIHEVFESVYVPHVHMVVFNGWVEGVDPATGADFRSCLVSCQATKDEFQKINLSKVDPKQCFRSLKGLSAGPLYNLAPVKPIMAISREDKRFVESRDVLAEVASIPNLATMDWEDFEHLVRGLFEKIFSHEGAEVRITRASRDLGVDAVAFDPDPIRGGKFVIQAKRYNNVVPLSAVRDLYGTMINEGAVKGILVTTSYFGPDAYEFVKDKPITLIDGSNLVYMLAQHGYNVKIELQKSVKTEG